MFNHDLIDLPKLIREDGEIRRYITPSGLAYPSVTTVLSKTMDHSGLDSWRNRVGDVEADRVSNRSATRGTAIHSLCERYVLNQKIDYRKEMPINITMFRQIKKLLDDNVDRIMVSEGGLYSDRLKVAGTVDLVAEWNGEPAIIDFKTSNRNKLESWIEGYFLQTSMYSYMFWERTRILCKKLVILIAMESEPKPQVFIVDVKDWIEKSLSKCEEYHSN